MQAELFILSLAICQVLSACSPKKVNFLSFEKIPKRSQVFVVEATAEKCPGLTDIYYRWEVTDLNHHKIVQTATTASITINGYSFSSSTVFTTDFLLTVSVSHYVDMSASSWFSDTYRFSADQMHIEIKGGIEKTHPVNTTLDVDAESLSRDISYPPSEEAFEKNIVEWTVDPKLPGFTPPKSLVITVPGELLKLNHVYKFTVKVVRSKIPKFFDTKTAVQSVWITPPGVPELNIECLRNCLNPHPKEETALRVVCTKNCEVVEYRWTITPSIGPEKRDFGNGFQQIVIEPEAFKEGDKVDITVKGNAAVSSYSIIFIEKIKVGSCSITPGEGISGITKFSVKCYGFFSKNGNLLYMIYQKNKKFKKNILLNEDTSRSVSDIFLSESNPAEILVQVQDGSFEHANVQLSAEVKPFSPQQNTPKLVAIKTLILGDQSESVMSLSLEKFRNKVVQMVSYLLHVIESINNITEEVKRDLHKHMAESITNVNPHDFISASQIISILTKLQAFKLDTDTHTSRIIGKSMVYSSKIVHNLVFMHTNREDPFIPKFLIKQLADDICYLSHKLLKEVPKLEKVLEKEIVVHDYDSYDDMVSPKLKVRDNMRDLTYSVVVSVQIFGTTILHKTIPDEKPSTLKNEFMIFITRRVWLKTLMKNQTIILPGNPGVEVFVPNSLVEELQSKYSFIDYQFAVINENPFWWHKNHADLKTDIVLFDFFHSCKKLGTTKNPFYLHLKTKNVSTGVLKGNTTDGEIAAHRINVRPGSLLVIEFDKAAESYIVTSSSCFCKKSDFDNGIVILKHSKESERTIFARPSENNDVVYVCVMKSGASLEYTGNFAMFSCNHWNLKTGMWDSKGCKIQKASIQNSAMVCECTHASFFSGQILIPPNRVNLNLEFEFHIELIRNWITPTFIVVALILWGLFFFVAWLVDKRHVQKNFVCRLEDDVPGDSHAYVIVVLTGFYIDAETTANVTFQLIGDKAKSRVHLIRCAGVDFLNRNSQDWFVIHTPCYLGDLKKIRLWHNCRGTQPHWYCKRIVVQHLKSGLQYCFIVEKWFSLVWGSGQVYHELNVNTITFLKSNRTLFLLNLEKKFKDGHLWVSIFARDAQSNFTSLERVGALACTFFLSMLANAMFHGIPKKAPEDSIDKNSSYFITYRELAIFIESWLIAVPVGITVVQLFRKTSPYYQKKVRKSVK